MMAVALAAALACSGCGLTIPTDPDGTLERVRTEGVVRVGATPAGYALIVEDGAAGEVAGPLADLVVEFAEEEGARVEWRVASEETLVDSLEAGDLDLAVGGMTDATPWTDRVSVTRGYRDIEGAEGRSLVALLPLGENALQAAFESFLDREVER